MNKRVFSNLIALALAFVLTFETSFLHARDLSYLYRYDALSKSDEKASHVKSRNSEAFYGLAASRSASPLVLKPQWSNPSQVVLAMSRSVATAEAMGEQGQIVLTATIKDASGQPMPGVYVVWQLDKALVINPESGYTDAAGNISAVVSSIEALSTSVKLIAAGSIEFDTGQQITFERPVSRIIAGDLLIDTDTTITENLLVQGDLIVQDAEIIIVGQRVIEAENIVVGAGARVNADSTGHGAGRGASPGWPKQDSATGGGGHGGHGGQGDLYPPDEDPAWPGGIYGDIARPERLGSSGGVRNGDLSCPGAGGGAIKLVARGAFTHEGVISANGSPAAQDSGCGGGSGGSVWISATHLFGSGLIRANGGDGATTYYNNVELRGGGGGGGRIALHGNNQAQYALQALAGANGRWLAQDGTALYVAPIDVDQSRVALGRMCYIGTHNVQELELELVGPSGPVAGRPILVQVEPALSGYWFRHQQTGQWEEAGWWNAGTVSVGSTDANGQMLLELRTNRAQPVTLTIQTADGVVLSPTLFITFPHVLVNHVAWTQTPSVPVAFVGETITLSGSLRDAEGHPVDIQEPVRFDAPSSDVVLSPASSVMPDAQGRFTATLRAYGRAQYGANVRVFSAGCEDFVGEPFYGLGVTFVQPQRIDWTSEVLTAYVRQAVTLTGQFLDELGYPIPGRSVQLGLHPDYAQSAVFESDVVWTDAEGFFTATLTATRGGEYVLQVAVRLDDEERVFAQHELTVVDPVIPGSQSGVRPSTVEQSAAWHGDSVNLVVDLLTPDGSPLQDWQVEVYVESSEFLINGGLGQAGQWQAVGSTQQDGRITFTLSALNTSGEMPVYARALSPFTGEAYTLNRSTVITFVGAPIEQVSWQPGTPSQLPMGVSAVVTAELFGPESMAAVWRSLTLTCSVEGSGTPCTSFGIHTDSSTFTSDLNGQVVVPLTFTPTFASVRPFTLTFSAVVSPPVPYERLYWLTQRFTNVLMIGILPPQPSATHTTMVVSPSLLAHSLSSGTHLTVDVRDEFGRALPGRWMTLSISSPGFFYAGNRVRQVERFFADEQGILSLPIYASAPGRVTATVAIDDWSEQPVVLSHSVEFVKVVQKVDLSVDRLLAVADGQYVVRLSAWARTAADGPVPSRTITVAPNVCCGAGVTVVPITRQTGLDGRMDFLVTSTQAVDGLVLDVVVPPGTLGDAVSRTWASGVVFVDPEVNGVSPTRSEIVSSDSLTYAQGTASVWVVVRDMRGNPAPHRSVDAVVRPNPLTGSGVLTLSGGTSRQFDGAVSYAFNAGRVGVYTVTALVREIGRSTPIVVSQALTLTFIPGPVDPLLSRVRLGASQAYIAEGVTVTVVLTDAAGRSVPNATVRLVSSSPLSITDVQPRTDQNGRATFVVYTETVGTVVLQAQYKQPLDSANALWSSVQQPLVVSFLSPFVDAARSTVTVDRAMLLADGQSTAEVTVSLFDRFGNPSGGTRRVALVHNGSADVTLQPADGVVTTTNGVAKARISAVNPQMVTVRAVLPDEGITVAQRVSVEFVLSGVPDLARSVFTASRLTQFADGNSAVTVSVTLLNADGRPLPLRAVSLRATGLQTSAVSVEATDAHTYTNRLGSVSWRIKSSIAQTLTLLATDEATGAALQQALVVSFISGPVATLSLVEVSPPYLQADGVQSALISVTLRDGLGRALPFYPVQLVPLPTQGTLGEPIITPSLMLTSDSRGQVAFRVASNRTGGWSFLLRDLTYRQLVWSSDNVLPLPAVRFYGEVASRTSWMRVDKNPALAYGIETVNISARLLDAVGQPVPNASYRFIASRQDVTLTQLVSRTTHAGDLRATLAAHQPGALTVWLMSPNGEVIQSMPITFYAPSLWQAQSQFVVSGSPAVADGARAVRIQATLRSVTGAPLANRQVRILVSGAGVSTPAGQVRSTDAQGVVTFTIASTKAERKYVSLEDVLTDQSVQAGHVDFEPSSPDVARSSVMLSKSTARAGGHDSILLTLILRDANQNLIPNQRVTVSAGEHVSVTTVTTGTDQTGVFQAELRASRAHTAPIVVTVQGSDGNTYAFSPLQATFIESVSPERSAFSLSSRTITADGRSNITVTAQLRDASGEPLSGRRIRLVATRPGSSAELSLRVSPAREVQTDERGEAQIRVAATSAGEVNLRLLHSEDAQVLTQTLVRFTADVPDPTLSRLDMQTGRYLYSGEAAVAVVSVKDAYGNPVGGRQIRLEIAGSDLVFSDSDVYTTGTTYVVTRSTEEGSFSVSFTSFAPQSVTVEAWDAPTGVRLGQVTIVRFDERLSDSGGGSPTARYSATVRVLPPAQAAANAQDLVQVRVHVQDQEGNNLSGMPVHLSLPALDQAAYVVLPQDVQVTSEDGTALFAISAIRAGVFTVQVRDIRRELVGTGQVTFTAGMADPTKTEIELVPYRLLPADGFTPYSVAVTVRDSFGNPVSNAEVRVEVQSAASGLSIVQPTAPTNAQGRAWAQVYGTTRVPVTLTALVNGVSQPVTTQVRFGGPDVVLAQNVRSAIYPAGQFQYEIYIVNSGVLTAQQVVVESVLDDRVELLEQVSSEGDVSFVQLGSLLRWQIPELAPRERRAVLVSARAQRLSVGDLLQITSTVTLANADEDSTNNGSLISEVVTSPMGHQATLIDGVRVVGSGVGNQITYTLLLTNTGISSDTYRVLVRLPTGSSLQVPGASLYSPDVTGSGFLAAETSLGSGESTAVLIPVKVNGCEPAVAHPIDVLVAAEAERVTRSLPAVLQILPAPDMLYLQPMSGFVSSGAVVFSWLTHSADASGSVELRQEGASAVGKVYTTTVTNVGGGLFGHTVVVNEWVDDGTYVWQASLTSRCGIFSSAPARLRLADGVRFTAAKYAATIERDYNQQIVLNVVNPSQSTRTISVSVYSPNSDSDLVFGFVGEGSQDRVMELAPGESRAVRLFVHAQNASLSKYDLVARISSVPQPAGEGAGIFSVNTVANQAVGQARVEIVIKPPAISYTLQEVSNDPDSMVRRYVLTNHGDPLTDIRVETKSSGEGRLLTYPDINHAYLRRGESLEFEVIPQVREDFRGLDSEIVVLAANGRLNVKKPVKVTMPSGKQIYHGRANNVVVEGASVGWYCTNKPNISYAVPMASINAGSSSLASEVLLSMSFAPDKEALPHNTVVGLNGETVAFHRNKIPSGMYKHKVDPAVVLKVNVLKGQPDPVVRINTEHMNRGHYVVQTGATLRTCHSVYEEPVIASSQAEADAIVRSRSYLKPAPSRGGKLTIVYPPEGQSLFPGEEVQVLVRVEGEPPQGQVYLRAPFGQVFPMHRTSYSGIVYSATWSIGLQGVHELAVSADDCGYDDDLIHVRVVPPPESPDRPPRQSNPPPPWRGSFFQAYPLVALPDGKSQIVVTLTLKDPASGSVISGTQVRIHNATDAAEYGLPDMGVVVSKTGVTNQRGQFSATLTSRMAGPVRITAYDLTNDRPISASILVHFGADGELEVRPRGLRADGEDVGVITVTLTSQLVEQVSGTVVYLASSRERRDHITPTRLIVNQSGIATATISSTVKGNTVISAFIRTQANSSPTGSPSTVTATELVSIAVGSPAFVRFTDATMDSEFAVTPRITYTSLSHPHQVVATFRMLRGQVQGVPVTLTTSGSEWVSRRTGVTDGSGVFTAAIRSISQGETTVTVTYYDPTKKRPITYTEVVTFLRPVGNISVTVTPTPAIKFPGEEVTFSGVLRDSVGKPAAGRHVLLELRDVSAKSVQRLFVTTDEDGAFTAQYAGRSRDERLEVHAFEVLKTPDQSFEEESPQVYLGLQRRAGPVIFVSDRPTQLRVVPEFGRSDMRFTATVNVRAGVFPFTNSPSISTPLHLQLRSKLLSTRVVKVQDLTTNSNGRAWTSFTPPENLIGDVVVEVVNAKTNKVAASQDIHIAGADSTCRGKPKVISYTSNYMLSESVFYLGFDFSDTLTISVGVDWMGCTPGMLTVRISSLPEFRKDYPVTGTTTSTGTVTISRRQHTLGDVTNVFKLPDGRNIISIYAVSQDGISSQPLALTHRKARNISEWWKSTLAHFVGVGKDYDREADRFPLNLFLNSPIDDAINRTIEASFVKHPVTKQSLRAYHISIIFPHPADKDVTGFLYRLEGWVTGNPAKKRSNKVSLPLGHRNKSVNLINLALPFACDVGPFANMLMIRFIDNKFYERKLSSAKAAKRYARWKLGQLNQLNSRIEKYIDRNVVRKEKDGEVTEEYSIRDKKTGVGLKFFAALGLPPFICDLYKTDWGRSLNPSSFIEQITLGPFRFSVALQNTWTFAFFPLVLRIVPGLGTAVGSALDLACDLFGVEALCGPEAYIQLGLGFGASFVFKVDPSQSGRLPLALKEDPKLTIGPKVTFGLEWALDKILYIQAEASVGGKMTFVTRGQLLVDATVCLKKVVVEGEAFFKAVLSHLWATEIATEGEFLTRDFECPSGGTTPAPAEDDDDLLDEEEENVFIDFASDEFTAEDNDAFLPANASVSADGEGLNSSGGLFGLDLEQLREQSLDKVLDVLSLGGGVSDTGSALVRSPQSAARYRLIPPVGRGDPNYAAFASPSNARLAFAQRMAQPMGSHAAAATTISSVLVSNIFTYTSVAIAQEPNGDRAVLVWSHDDPARPAGGSREIMYSLWDGNSWRQPVNLTQDDVVDLHPSVVWDTSGRIVVAWVRAGQRLSDTVNMNLFEIASATISPDEGRQPSMVLVTKNGHPDVMPKLLHDGQGRVMLLWQELHPTPQGKLVRSAMLGLNGLWSSAEVALSGASLSFDADYRNGEAVLVAAVPISIPGGVTATHQVVLTRRVGNAWQPARRVSTNDNINHRPVAVVYRSDGTPILGWIADKQLVIRVDGAEMETEQLIPFAPTASDLMLRHSPQGNLAVLVQDSLRPAGWWMLPIDAQSVEYGLIGQPIRLSAPLEESVLGSDAVFDDDGRLLAGYVRALNELVTITVPITRVIEDTAGMTQTITQEMEFERLIPYRTDLVTLAHLPGRDMELFASAEYSAPEESNMLILVEVRARNRGDFVENVSGNNLALEFYVGDPGTQGLLVERVEITQAIPPGGLIAYPYSFVVSPTEQLTLGIRLVNRRGDPRPTNNVVLIPLQFSSVPRVSSIDSFNLMTTSSSITAMFALNLSNNGMVTSTQTTMTVVLVQRAPVVTRTIDVPPIPPGETRAVTAEVPITGLSGGQYTLTARLAGSSRLFTSVRETPTDLKIEEVEWTDLSHAPVAVDVRVRNNSMFTASEAKLMVEDGSFNGVVHGGGGLVELLPDIPPNEAVTVTLVLTKPQVCNVKLSVLSLNADEIEPEDNVHLIANDRLCFQVALDLVQVEMPTSTLSAANIAASVPMSRWEGVAPMTVQAVATTGLQSAQWLWDFGDGVTDTRRVPALRTYERAGIYPINVRVTDPESGAEAVAGGHLFIYSPTVPIIGCQGCDAARVGSVIQLSNDSEGRIERVEWDLGEGGVTMTEPVLEYAYGQPGIYTITLRVKGFEGDWRTTTRTITVTNGLIRQVYLPVVVSQQSPIPQRRVYLPSVAHQRRARSGSW